MEQEKVDIFIPVAEGHAHVLPAALCSALTQTYPNKRVVLFLDGITPRLEKVVKKWLYKNDNHRIPTQNQNISIEYFEENVIVRNSEGPSRSAHVARQWLFEWTEKSKYVKMLDADDILTPRSLEIMMKYMKPEIDGVFCPMIRTANYVIAETLKSIPFAGIIGSGAMLLKKRCMEKMIEQGYTWPSLRGHDKGFYEFMKGKEDQYKFITAKEDALYFYLK